MTRIEALEIVSDWANALLVRRDRYLVMLRECPDPAKLDEVCDQMHSAAAMLKASLNQLRAIDPTCFKIAP